MPKRFVDGDVVNEFQSNPLENQAGFLFDEMINIAIQKSGRLNQGSLSLLKKCGIGLHYGDNQLKVMSRNFPLSAYFLRNSDIPQYLRDGIVDLAILGSNLLEEKGEDLKIVSKLGFAKCRVSIAVPKSYRFESIKDLEGKQIATSYPNTLKKYLRQNKVSATIHVINGSVEIAPNIGLATAICDIVSSGSTLFQNNLKEVLTILESEAVLVKAPNLSKQKQTLVDRLNFRIDAVIMASKYRYILCNVPNKRIDDVSKLLPVLKSPTVLPLVREGWSSLHSVIGEGDFWEVIDKLKDAGAEDILVCPIEKMVK